MYFSVRPVIKKKLKQISSKCCKHTITNETSTVATARLPVCGHHYVTAATPQSVSASCCRLELVVRRQRRESEVELILLEP